MLNRIFFKFFSFVLLLVLGCSSGVEDDGGSVGPVDPPSEIIPTGYEGLRIQLEKFIEVGASKFVPVLVGEPDDWFAELEGVADSVLKLHN